MQTVPDGLKKKKKKVVVYFFGTEAKCFTLFVRVLGRALGSVVLKPIQGALGSKSGPIQGLP